MARTEEMAHIANSDEYLMYLMDEGLTREQAEAKIAEQYERHHEELACVDPDCSYAE